MRPRVSIRSLLFLVALCALLLLPIDFVQRERARHARLAREMAVMDAAATARHREAIKRGLARARTRGGRAITEGEAIEIARRQVRANDTWADRATYEAR